MIVTSVDVHVSVTQQHMDWAVPRRPFRCMIKLATRDALGEAGFVNAAVRVDKSGIWATLYPQHRYRAALTPEVFKRLLAFDDHQRVEPFEFDAYFRFAHLMEARTPERREQINKARRARGYNGKSDSEYLRVNGVGRRVPKIKQPTLEATL